MPQANRNTILERDLSLDSRDTAKATELLVASNDSVSTEILAKTLIAQGYQVRIAKTGSETAATCKAYPPDLAILCIDRAVANELETVRILRREFCVPFLLCATDSDKETIKQAAAEGALGYLINPIDANNLAPAIEIALARARDWRAAEALLDRRAEGLESKREIDIAVGLILERFNLNRTQALEVLRRMARSTNRKLIDTAVEIVESSERIASANRLVAELLNDKRRNN